jgi:hypothetical protein
MTEESITPEVEQPRLVTMYHDDKNIYYSSMITEEIVQTCTPFQASTDVPPEMYILIDGIPVVRNGKLLPEYERILVNKLNSLAHILGYDDIYRASLRAAYTGPYQEEGRMFGRLMDESFASLYALYEECTRLNNYEQLETFIETINID